MVEKSRAFPDKTSEEYILSQSSLAAMTSIAIVLNRGEGAGFFVSGPFGSGKTRLLMALQNLSMTHGVSPWLRVELGAFGESEQRQVRFVREVFRAHRIVPCYIHLGADDRSLSAALEDAIRQQHPQIFPDTADLLTSLDAIDASLSKAGHDVLIVLVDELASNLGRKNVTDALQDIFFLQQLGGVLRDHRIVLVLTVHRSIRVLDNLRYGQLNKMMDRYRVLSLHIEGALARRFAARFDDDDLVLTTPHPNHRELHEAAGIYSVDESRTELLEASFVGVETPGWLAEMTLTKVEPPTPPPPTIMNPVRKLAEILMECCEEEDLNFLLQSKEIAGRTREAQVLELCIAEDPLVILTELFKIGRLREVAQNLDLEIGMNIGPDQLREAILVRLGFSIPKKAVGINTRKRRLIQLRSTLQLKGQRADIIGIGLEGCDDVGERVLKDIITFYCTVLLGTDYEQVLWEKELVPAKGRPSLGGLTFGQKIGLFESLNGYIKRYEEAKDLMHKWFGRVWVIKNNTHIQKYLNQVSARRNLLAHPQKMDTPTLKREADEALRLLVELFEQFEEQLIYPPVIAVEAIQIDRYGRRTYICVDDRGCPEHIFTHLELMIGQEYFFYPITNPIRVDPLIVLKQ